MATVNEVYKVALENRNAINTMKDLAKETEEFPDAGTLNDADVVRVSRSNESLKTTVGAIKAASGGGDDNVRSDWNQANSNDDSFILNKPENLSDFNNDLNVLGDMTKNVYDQDNSGSVEDSKKLGGEVPGTYDQRSHVTDNDIHVTSTQKDAISGANAPSSGNVFATMLDINNLVITSENIAKYPSNSGGADVLEVNDIVYDLWWTTSLYIKCMRYDGGDDTLIASYTILDSVEF